MYVENDFSEKLKVTLPVEVKKVSTVLRTFKSDVIMFGRFI